MQDSRERRILTLFQQLPGDIWQKEFRHGGLIGVYKHLGLSCCVMIFAGEKGPPVLSFGLSMLAEELPDGEPRVAIYDKEYITELDAYVQALVEKSDD